jgi:hypothetical protein
LPGFGFFAIGSLFSRQSMPEIFRAAKVEPLKFRYSRARSSEAELMTIRERILPLPARAADQGVIAAL